MSEEWQAMGNAPLDRQILLDVGLPWPVVGSWCGASEAWVYANFQIGMYESLFNDAYFENEHEYAPKCWRELPRLRGLE